MPETYNVAGDPSQSLLTNFRIHNGGGYAMITTVPNSDPVMACGQLKLYGSLFYLLQDDKYSTANSLVQVQGRNCIDIRHVFVFIHPAHERASIVRGFDLSSSGWAAPNLSATNLTSVRGRPGDTFGAQWTVRNVSAGGSLGAIAHPWTTITTGANLCKRWGTNEPLWPWPMNDRIKAATASAGSYSGPCPSCNGGRFARTTTDVTATVESLLGPIPPACLR
jgi:hypothetical protein